MIARDDDGGAGFAEICQCLREELDRMNWWNCSVEDVARQQEAIHSLSDHNFDDRCHEILLRLGKVELMQRSAQVPVTGVEEAHMEKVGVWSDILAIPRRSVGAMKHPIADAVDVRLAESLHRIESQIDYRPVKVASWGVAAASVLGAVAAGFGAVAAIAGAYAAVKTAIRVSHEGREPKQEVTAGRGTNQDDAEATPLSR